MEEMKYGKRKRKKLKKEMKSPGIIFIYNIINRRREGLKFDFKQTNK